MNTNDDSLERVFHPNISIGWSPDAKGGQLITKDLILKATTSMIASLGGMHCWSIPSWGDRVMMAFLKNVGEEVPKHILQVAVEYRSEYHVISWHIPTWYARDLTEPWNDPTIKALVVKLRDRLIIGLEARR